MMTAVRPKANTSVVVAAKITGEPKSEGQAMTSCNHNQISVTGSQHQSQGSPKPSLSPSKIHNMAH